MSILPILMWPDPVLSQPCVAVEAQDVAQLAGDMLETMYAAQGRGLAAPQVGRLLRVFVVDIAWKEETPEPIVCIDPWVIAISDDKVTHPEVCLSIPGVVAEVTRPARVQLAWRETNGAECEQWFDGIGAICVQHELDHLDGLVTFDRVPATERKRLLEDYG